LKKKAELPASDGFSLSVTGMRARRELAWNRNIRAFGKK